MSDSDWFKLSPTELGISTYGKFDGDNLLVHTEADSAPSLDYVNDLKSSGWDGVIDKDMGMTHVAHIPAWLIVHWMNEGFDYSKDLGETLKRIERDYPALKIFNGRLA